MHFISLKIISLACLYLAVALYAGCLIFLLLDIRELSEVFLIAGFIIHTFSQVSRGYFIGIFTPNAVVEGIFFLPWCLACLLLSLRLFKKEGSPLGAPLVLLCFFAIIALFYPKGVIPMSPYTKTAYSTLFFFFEIFAHACFLLGACFGFLYIRGKEKSTLFNSLVIWGFILYSIAQVVGAIWCYLGWAALFNWSERHMQSATIWCFYAAYLHLHLLPSWDMKRRAAFSLAGGFIVFALSYSGHVMEMGMTRIGG